MCYINAAKKKDKKPSISVLIFFITCMVLSSIISWKNIFSLIPIIVSTINTWGIWQDNMKYTRCTALFAQIGWFIYDLIGGLYTGAIAEVFNLVSTIIAIWRYDINNKKGEIKKCK